jgi:hypothetical protein
VPPDKPKENTVPKPKERTKEKKHYMFDYNSSRLLLNQPSQSAI